VKDYRTWWRRGADAEQYLMCMSVTDIPLAQFAQKDYDYIEEQIWAIREGLA